MLRSIFGVLVTMLVAPDLWAREVWIHATGINPSERGGNYLEFYSGSNDFYAACRRVPARECRRMINPDLGLATDMHAGPRPTIRGENLGAPTRDGLLRSLRNVVEAAGPGDRLVISLEDHGSPATDAQGVNSPSCIWLNRTDRICESDLRQILRDLPRQRGFSVAVVANGCYSGAFTTLSNSNVCVVTAADQYSMSRSPIGAFWDVVNRRAPRTLAGMGAIADGSEGMLLGSERMLRDGCRTLRGALTEPERQNLDILHVTEYLRSLMSVGRCVDCGPEEGRSTRVLETVDASFAGDRRLSAAFVDRVCQAQPLVCDPLRRLASDTATTAQAQEYLRGRAAVRAAFQTFTAAVGASEAGLLPDEVQQLSYLSYSPSAAEVADMTAELPVDRRAAFGRAITLRRQALARYMAVEEREFPGLLRAVRSWHARVEPSLRLVQNCLLEDFDGGDLDSPAKAFPRRQYTSQDVQEAQQCEASFTL